LFASAHAFVVTDAAYRPRNPEESLLYQVVAGELETFLASHQAQDRTIPKFVEDEFRSFLECGILAHGFVRVRCESCGHSRLVPFSSRRRGAEREPDSLAQVLYLRAYRAGEEPPEDAWMLDWTDWAGAYEIMLRRRQEYQELTVSRWRDPVWLAWLAVPMLMVHMFEEYGFDVLGRTYDFPDGICRNLGYEPYPGCPIPPAHYPLVNLGSLGWARQLRRC
jgi:transposase-like zinc-binding protein